ncbi:unnamed protein product [Amoebophrya sp. A25]|nr:unnamed protein product [Amoebophrya sp. A25]|eukprot:GSA25T00022658001.1
MFVALSLAFVVRAGTATKPPSVPKGELAASRHSTGEPDSDGKEKVDMRRPTRFLAPPQSSEGSLTRCLRHSTQQESDGVSLSAHKSAVLVAAPAKNSRLTYHQTSTRVPRTCRKGKYCVPLSAPAAPYIPLGSTGGVEGESSSAILARFAPADEAFRGLDEQGIEEVPSCTSDIVASDKANPMIDSGKERSAMPTDVVRKDGDMTQEQESELRILSGAESEPPSNFLSPLSGSRISSPGWTFLRLQQGMQQAPCPEDSEDVSLHVLATGAPSEVALGQGRDSLYLMEGPLFLFFLRRGQSQTEGQDDQVRHEGETVAAPDQKQSFCSLSDLFVQQDSTSRQLSSDSATWCSCVEQQEEEEDRQTLLLRSTSASSSSRSCMLSPASRASSSNHIAHSAKNWLCEQVRLGEDGPGSHRENCSVENVEQWTFHVAGTSAGTDADDEIEEDGDLDAGEDKLTSIRKVVKEKELLRLPHDAKRRPPRFPTGMSVDVSALSPESPDTEEVPMQEEAHFNIPGNCRKRTPVSSRDEVDEGRSVSASGLTDSSVEAEAISTEAAETSDEEDALNRRLFGSLEGLTWKPQISVRSSAPEHEAADSIYQNEARRADSGESEGYLSDGNFNRRFIFASARGLCWAAKANPIPPRPATSSTDPFNCDDEADVPWYREVSSVERRIEPFVTQQQPYPASWGAPG